MAKNQYLRGNLTEWSKSKTSKARISQVVVIELCNQRSHTKRTCLS